MKSKKLAVLAYVAIVVSLIGQARGEKGGPIPSKKKLIGFAVNAVEPAYLKQHAGEMERVLPLDGLVISVYPDDWGDKKTGQEGMFFGGRRLTREDFQRTAADLKATLFKRFTDNFIQVETAARGSAITGKVEDGNLDWFDPNWRVIAENGAVAAWIAKEAGFKGLFLDVEEYTGALGPWKNIFNYSVRPDKDKRTPADVEAQVRRRGREWMEAVGAVYPDITIIIIQNTGWGRANMVEPFVKGMLEGRGRARLIDGGEGGYSMITREEFARLKESAHRTDKLFKPLEYAFGVWVDYFPEKFGGWHTDPAKFDKNYRSPSELENTLYGALTESDCYVWLFVWHPDVWFNPTVRPRPMPSQCVLCPHKKVPEAYLEALENCRKPHDLNWAPAIQQGRFAYFDDAVLVEGDQIRAGAKNLLKNPGFEKWSGTPNRFPDGWTVAGQGVEILQERKLVKSGRCSARLTTGLLQGHVIIDQYVPAKQFAGKTITLGAWILTSVKDAAGVNILDFVGSTHEVNSLGSGDNPGDGQWHFVTATKTIRPDATGEVRLRLSFQVPYVKGGVKSATLFNRSAPHFLTGVYSFADDRSDQQE